MEQKGEYRAVRESSGLSSLDVAILFRPDIGAFAVKDNSSGVAARR